MVGDSQSIFGARLKALRAERDLSLDVLAELSGVSKSYLWSLEHGKNVPTVDAAGKIADALGVRLSYLLGEDGGLELPKRLPKGLQDFVERCETRGEDLGSEDVMMLAGIRYRGRQPRTADDWAYVYETIKRTIR